MVSPTGSRPPSRNWNNEMPGDEELGFEAAVAALGKNLLQEKSFFICVLHPASFWMVRVSSSFQFGAEMKVFAWFVRTRCRRILRARVEVPLRSCEKWKGDAGQELNVKVVA